MLEARGLLKYPIGEWRLELTDAFLDAYAIDACVLSLAPLGVWFGDAGLARELARLANEQTAAVVATNPRRYAGLAVVPFPDIDAALEEIAYALDVLKLDGIAVLSNVDGAYPGDPSWAPMLAELDRRGAYLFIHPTTSAALPTLAQIPIWVQELPFDTTRAIANLIFSGALDDYPDLRVQVAHLGGTAPFLAHRIASLGVRHPEFADFTPARVANALASLYYDTGLSNHIEPIEATRAHVPFEHIVFGSDWPYAVLPDGPDFAPDLSALGADRRAALEGQHAAALVPRWAQE
jgi:6-methylsalicylate decarboxylase